MNEGVEEQPDAIGGAQTVNNRFREDSLYNPFPYDISIFRNRISNTHWFPAVQNDIGKLLIWYSPFTPPALLYDGIEDPQRSQRNICFAENGDVLFVNLDAGHDFESLSKDPAPFICPPEKLNPR
jgi:hypothetical protein